MIHKLIDIYERWSKCLKEALVPDTIDIAVGGFASFSFAGWMEAFSHESVHGVAVVVTAGLAAFVVHVIRYFSQKWMPIKKDKK